MVTLRAYLRQRERLVEYAAAHIQHMQKALMEMNVQLHHVVTNIAGETGMRIVRAMSRGTATRCSWPNTATPAARRASRR